MLHIYGDFVLYHGVSDHFTLLRRDHFLAGRTMRVCLKVMMYR